MLYSSFCWKPNLSVYSLKCLFLILMVVGWHRTIIANIMQFLFIALILCSPKLCISVLCVLYIWDLGWWTTSLFDTLFFKWEGWKMKAYFLLPLVIASQVVKPNLGKGKYSLQTGCLARVENTENPCKRGSWYLVPLIPSVTLWFISYDSVMF